MSGRDTRTASQQIIGNKERVISHSFAMIVIASLIGIIAATLPAGLGWEYYLELPGMARISVGIVVFAAFLWITEAIPAYAVSLVVIGLNVLLLSTTGFGGADANGFNIFGMGNILTNEGVQTQSALTFSQYLLPWASNLMWLFMAGFMLAEALTKTKLDIRFARLIMKAVGTKPMNVLLGAMGTTFLLSMFMSNTATAAMMIALMASFVRTLPQGEPFAKALYIGVPVAANVGGMGTIIGTPPNGIAVEALSNVGVHIDFITWTIIGLPVALVLFVVSFFAIMFFYKPTISKFEIEFEDVGKLPDDATPEEIAVQRKKNLERKITIGVFAITVLLWVTGKIHNISTYVIALIPIVVLGATSIVDAKGFRKLPWDVLMLLTGGLSMGVAIERTGLGLWLSGLVPADVSPMSTLLIVMLLALVMCNLLSRTVTASILIPIAVTMFPKDMLFDYIPIVALVCSTAMLLPISTPPNAVAFASGRLETKDFLKVGSVLIVIGPIVSAGWGLFITPLLGH